MSAYRIIDGEAWCKSDTKPCDIGVSQCDRMAQADGVKLTLCPPL